MYRKVDRYHSYRDRIGLIEWPAVRRKGLPHGNRDSAAYRELPVGNPINDRALHVFRPNAGRVASMDPRYSGMVGARGGELTCLELQRGTASLLFCRDSSHNYSRMARLRRHESDSVEIAFGSWIPSGAFQRQNCISGKLSHNQWRISKSGHPSDVGRSVSFPGKAGNK